MEQIKLQMKNETERIQREKIAENAELALKTWLHMNVVKCRKKEQE